MARSLTLVTGPSVEPVTLAEAKAFARIDHDSDDSQISSLIVAARQAAEEYLRRSLVTQTWKLTLDQTASGVDLPAGVYNLPVSALYAGLPRVFNLPRGPVQSVTSFVTYDANNDASTLVSSNYFADTGGDRLVMNQNAVLPANLRPSSAVAITYVAGYGLAVAVPQPIKTAIMMHVASLYEQRGQCEDAMDLPPGAKQLLRAFRILGDRG